MMRDYRERRPVKPNRPRRQGGGRGMFFLLMLVPFLLAYGLGFGTGWFVFGRSTAPLPPQGGTPSPSAPSPAATSQVAPPAGIPDPPLTFYDTLPKGKVVLGSGLNPVREIAPQIAQPDQNKLPAPTEGVGAASPPAPASQTPVAKVAKPPVPVPPARDGGTSSSEGKPSVGTAPKGKFSVQIASSATRQEAEAIQQKLSEKGFSAYVVESQVSGKGKVFRVRVGRGMDIGAANAMAAKTGPGSIVILE